MNQNESLLALEIAVLTLSDTRTEADDKSGKRLKPKNSNLKNS